MSKALTATQFHSFFANEERRKAIVANLPKSVNQDVFMNSVYALALSDMHRNADVKDIFRCVHEAARDGLVLDKREAAIVPFKGKMTYIPMVAGVVKRLINSGQIAEISLQTVHENDEFDLYETHEGKVMHFRQCLKGDRGLIMGAFCRIKFTHGGTNIEYMTTAEINKRRPSHSKGDSPWATWYEEMAKKTVLKKASKLCTMSSEMYSLLEKSFGGEEEEAPAPKMQDVTPSAPELEMFEDMAPVATVSMEEIGEEAPPIPPYPYQAPLFEGKKEAETSAIKSVLGFAQRDFNDDYGDGN